MAVVPKVASVTSSYCQLRLVDEIDHSISHLFTYEEKCAAKHEVDQFFTIYFYNIAEEGGH